MRKKQGVSTQSIALIAMLSALVVLLQILSTLSRAFLPFSVSFALIAIILGAALCGPLAGGFLGFICAIVILFTDSAAFWVISPVGTLITVMAKGIFCGTVAGLVFKALRGIKNPYLAIGVASISCPIVNTGIFLLGCRIFFMPTITEWAANSGFENAGYYMLTSFVGINFLVEVITVVIVCPLILRLLKIKTDNLY